MSFWLRKIAGPEGPRVVRIHHRAAIRSLISTPDGKSIIFGDEEGGVYSLPVESDFQPVQLVVGSGAPVVGLAWQDGYLAVVSTEPRLQVIQVVNEDSVNMLSCSWGHVLAGASGDGSVRLWDCESGRELACLRGHEGLVNALRWSGDGRILASGSEDKTVRLWDRDSGRPLACLHGHEGSVNALSWSGDGRVLASGSEDKTVRLWDATSGQLLRTLEGHTDSVNALAGVGGHRIVSASSDKTVRVWDASSGQLLRTLEGHTKDVNVLAVLKGGRLASGSSDCTVRVWNLASGESLVLVGHRGGITALAALGDGRIASGSGDGMVRVWDLAGGSSLVLEVHTGEVNVLAVLEGDRLASASLDKTVRVWDATSGQLLRTLEGHTKDVKALAVLKGGRLASASDDKTVRLWDCDSGRELACLRGAGQEVSIPLPAHPVLVVASPFYEFRGAFIVICEDGGIRTWFGSQENLIQTRLGLSARVCCALSAVHESEIWVGGKDGGVAAVHDGGLRGLPEEPFWRHPAGSPVLALTWFAPGVGFSGHEDGSVMGWNRRGETLYDSPHVPRPSVLALSALDGIGAVASGHLAAPTGRDSPAFGAIIAIQTPDARARAEGHYNAYRAALNDGSYGVALEELKMALRFDPARFAPFPLDDYDPQRILGAGGFGEVFLCKKKLTGTNVAIKTLHADQLERDGTLVLQQASILSQLAHPAIIRLNNWGYVDPPARARPYIEMDYFESDTLEAYVSKHGPLPVGIVLALFKTVAEALNAAHGQGILHRDLKPANVLVRSEAPDWQVKLIGFGLALHSAAVDSRKASPNTLVGKSIAGTLQYAAPEQLGMLREAAVGPASDVYGLAKTCCYALFQTPDPTPQHWQSISEPLGELLRRCLERLPDHRPSGFNAVLQLLDDFAKPKPTPHPKSGPTPQPAPPAPPPPEPIGGDMISLADSFEPVALGYFLGFSGATGAYVNTYTYFPFGQVAASTIIGENPFIFIDQSGVMNNGSGLQNIRARDYNLATGQFVSNDPRGLDQYLVDPISIGNVVGEFNGSFKALTVSNGAAIASPEALHVNGSSIVTVAANSSLLVASKLLGTTQNPTVFNSQGTVPLNGEGPSSAHELLATMNADLGSGAANFTDDFAYGTLIVSGNNYVKLVDRSDNSPGATAQTVYANSLIVPIASTLNLNGLNLYLRDLQIAGTVIGRTIIQVSNSGGDIMGPLGLNWSTPWQTTAATASNGTVTITLVGGNERVFQPGSRTSGAFFSQPGDTGTLTADGRGGYLLTEADGTATTFNQPGQGYFTSLTVNSGSHLIVSGNTFSLSQLTLSAGSVFNAGDLSNDAFNQPLYLPASGVALLSAAGGGSNYQQFQDIDILAGTLAAGKTVNLNEIGTISTANLRYVFPNGFTVGRAGTFTITPSGNPTATLSQTGSLPSGVTFVDNGDGTANLGGTPAAGTSGSYSLTIAASNGTSPDASQSFTLTINAAPASVVPTITSGNTTAFTVATGATLNVGANVPVLVQTSQTLTVNGAMTLASGDTLSLSSNYAGGTQVVVNGTLTATGTDYNPNGTSNSIPMAPQAIPQWSPRRNPPTLPMVGLHSREEIVGELLHADSVLHLAAIPGGKLLSASADGTVQLWDVFRDPDGRWPRSLARHGKAVSALLLLPGGEVVSAAGRNVELWMPGGAALTTARAGTRLPCCVDRLGVVTQPPLSLRDRMGIVVRSVAVGENDAVVALDEDGNVWVRTAPSLDEWHRVPIQDPVDKLSGIDDDGWLVTVHRTGMVRAWHIPSWESEDLFRTEGICSALALQRQPLRVALGRPDGRVEVWRSEMNEVALVHRHQAPVNAVAFLGTGQVVSAAEDGSIMVSGPAATASSRYMAAEPVLALAVEAATSRVFAALESLRVVTLRLEPWPKDGEIENPPKAVSKRQLSGLEEVKSIAAFSAAPGALTEIIWSSAAPGASTEISPSNPTAIVFLLDQSGSMSEPFGKQPEKRKADGVADAINRLLQNLVLKCAKADGVRDFFHVGLIGYGGRVVSAFGGALAGQTLVPISRIANSPVRVEQRTRKVDDGAGGLIEQKFKFPVWFEAHSTGRTPMCAALATARTYLETFLAEHPGCYPPLAINITDGMASDGDPLPAARQLLGLASRDGNVLLFNAHISDKQSRPIEFPGDEGSLPDLFAQLLFRMSSPLPPKMREAARAEGFLAGPGARGFVFNADLVAVIRFLDIGTRVAQSVR